MLTSLFCALSPFISFSQGKEANIWYFGVHAGIDFNTGSPPSVLLNGQTYLFTGPNAGSACISDANGNLLFYTDGVKIWNQNHVVMQNGDNLGYKTTQGAMIVKDPGNQNYYYFFNYAWETASWQYFFQYSVIDMALDNGLGGVVPSLKNIRLGSHMSEHLSAVHHANTEDVWVVAHGLGTSNYYSFLVTADSLHTQPVVSNAGGIFTSNSGYMKISPDGQLIGAGVQIGTGGIFNLLSFNNATGVISENFYLSIPMSSFGVEFSPDNNKLYISGGISHFIQLDLNAGSSQDILNSMFTIGTAMGALQLGPDGKIYCAHSGYYLGVINNPNEAGIACNYDPQGVFLGSGYCSVGLPSFIQSYLNDPEYATTQHCAGQPTQFNIANTNGIDSVYWKFKDFSNMPNDTSTLLSPAYTFSGPGTYYPELTVYSGLLHKTVKDTVVIYPLPTPQLGSDTLFCPGATINLTLNAGPGDTYNWNGNFTPGSQTLAVTDTGTYFVRVRQHGCNGYDTIQVGSYPPATADITNVQFNNSNCNQTDGSITGMVFGAVIPFGIVWHNDGGVEVGTGPDLLNVPAGSYMATINFGDNCTHEFGPYPISDNNATQIADVLPTPDHCNQGMGGLSVLPASGNPADFLYSLNGGPYQANGGLFTGLGEGGYHISLKDAAGCISNVYTQVIENIPGPEIDCIATPETGSNNGIITVIPDGENLTYQLEGYPPQTTNEFTGLSAGEYYVWVTDAFGCSTPDTVIVGTSSPGLLLLALAGTDRKCLNKPARSDIGISRVSEMTEMKATLYYNGSLLNCTNFNANGDVFPNIQSQLFASPPRVEIFWQSTVPVSSSDTLTLGTFIFETTQAGTADIHWEELSPVTYFLNASQDTIYPVFHPGIIEVFEIPKASINNTNQVCEEDSVTLLAEIAGGADPMEYAWQTPTGSSQAALSLPITNAKPQDGGLYRFTVKDLNNCADTLVYNLEVAPKPTANFPTTTDTIYYEQQTQLQATPGYASYQWNTGDTTYYINVTEEGDYSVLMQTAEGCSKLEKVTLVDTWFPFNIPNAFTPNGDGLNDTFHPVTDYDRFSKFSMVIYNSWGQKQFETTNPAEGWDGKDAAAGVYVWVITYADYLGKVSTLRGSVTMVK